MTMKMLTAQAMTRILLSHMYVPLWMFWMNHFRSCRRCGATYFW